MKRKYDDEEVKATSKLVHIPLDIVEVEILTRLPVKSLLKFRCVSEIWSSIIRSQRFIDSYFVMSLSTRSRFIIALSNAVCNKPEEKRIFFFSTSHERNKSSLVANMDMTIPNESFSIYSAVPCASVHGFLGIKVGDRFIICNPSTKQVIKIPNNNNFLVYDPVDDQHKVISLEWGTSNHNDVKVMTIGGGGECEGRWWRYIKDTTTIIMPYTGVCIDGFLYYGGYGVRKDQQNQSLDDAAIACFDVRSEKLSFINAPYHIMSWGNVLIEYKGKLATIVRDPFDRFDSFDLWILEDVEKHEWSKQTCAVPPSLWDYVEAYRMSFPGTNKAGEIIMAPEFLTDGPYYIFYYNVETKNIRQVRIKGLEEFRNGYDGIGSKGDKCHVRIIPQHVDSIRILKSWKGVRESLTF